MILKNYLEFSGKVMLFDNNEISAIVREWSLTAPFAAYRVVTDHSVTKTQ